ncbi:Alpha/Beta hydrolase protein [Dactylonectria estremocensis]|uniref:Alpha/Beta hydrolase protein n=1 Tax=Dactylonectria estremocensis TaxID=1079267 RepID=A0A9P9IEJ6_9HYPO|nr:Alpha/Beta hydrolase protein [Dactylonectria estremocensis]
MPLNGDDVPRETICHPVIGHIRGIKRYTDLVQFLGVQYATLKDRFARGELCQNYPSAAGHVLDADHFGPLPMSPVDGCEHEQRLIQRSLPFSPFHQSDTQCLTLNISAPSGHGPGSLPVLVFVHGGAFATGSSSYPQCDLAPITNMSVEAGTPMISVGINYRVGAPGFLYSSTMKDAGYRTNNGLDDQRLALRWINHHIAGFGGDPARVTFLGESAGAASGFFHLHHPEPLFHQFVAMSGSSQQRLRRVEQADTAYTSVLEALDAMELPPKQQIDVLLETPINDFLAKVGRRFPIGPLIDGDSIPVGTTFRSLRDKDEVVKLFPGLRHCKRVIIGDCQMDGMAFSSRVSGRTDILPRTMERCMSAVFDSISPNIAQDLGSRYGLDIFAEANTPETLEPVLRFGNDVMFSLPAREFARAWSESNVPDTEAFLCHFNAPNPWDGPWKGHATHIQDIAFVLQNYRDTLSVGQRRCGERYANDLIAFVNGAKPWPAYQSDVEPGSMVYDAPSDGDEDESRFVLEEAPALTGRRDLLQKVVGEELFDKLVDVWQMFMLGGP